MDFFVKLIHKDLKIDCTKRKALVQGCQIWSIIFVDWLSLHHQCCQNFVLNFESLFFFYGMQFKNLNKKIHTVRNIFFKNCIVVVNWFVLYYQNDNLKNVFHFPKQKNIADKKYILKPWELHSFEKKPPLPPPPYQ